MNMSRKIQITEKKLINFLNRLVEQEDDSYYKISPQEYLELLKLSGYHGKGITKLPMFGGKPLWITGNLDVSGLPVDDLGNIGYIDGKLDISNTNVGDVSQIQVKGYISDYGSKRDKLRKAAELRQKRAEAAERREENEWNPENTDDVGIKANALFEWLVGQNELSGISDEEKEELKNLEVELEQLKERYDSDELESNEVSELYDKITEIEERIEELTGENVDVYDLVEKGNHYGLTTFEVLSLGDREYTVGTESEMDEAGKEYTESYIDDVGIEGFNRSFIEDYIDEDELRGYIHDFYYDDVSQNPDVYFDEDDFELTEEQEKRKEELENYISEMEDMKSNLEDEQKEIEDSDSDEYLTIQEKLDEIDENIDTAQEELDSIEPDTEPTDEMIEDKVEDYVNDRMRDPLAFIEEFGLKIDDFIDKDELAQGLLDTDGYGVMNSYDGEYDTIGFNDETYYIMRVN